MYPTMVQWNDQDLARRISGFFLDRQLTDVTALEIQAAGGVIVISGRVCSEREKALCLQYCRHVAGVVRVEDQLQVSREETAATAGRESKHSSALMRSSICLPTMS